MNNEELVLLNNLKRQALRLKKILQVPLNKAQLLLAYHFYHQRSISDVKKKIRQRDFSDQMFLVFVAPDAPNDIIDRFLSELNYLVAELEKATAELPIEDHKKLIFEVFGLDN